MWKTLGKTPEFFGERQITCLKNVLTKNNMATQTQNTPIRQFRVIRLIRPEYSGKFDPEHSKLQVSKYTIA